MADKVSQLQLAGQNGQESQPSVSFNTADDTVPITRLHLLVVLVFLILAISCVALDNTIILTVIPRITDECNTLNDVR